MLTVDSWQFVRLLKPKKCSLIIAQLGPLIAAMILLFIIIIIIMTMKKSYFNRHQPPATDAILYSLWQMYTKKKEKPRSSGSCQCGYMNSHVYSALFARLTASHCFDDTSDDLFFHVYISCSSTRRQHPSAYLFHPRLFIYLDLCIYIYFFFYHFGVHCCTKRALQELLYYSKIIGDG